MRPYSPNIDTNVAHEVITLVCSQMYSHGIPDTTQAVMEHALCAWRATLERILYANMKDNFRDAVVVALEDQSSMVSYNDRHRQALRAAMQGVASLVDDPDDVSLHVQAVQAHEDKETSALFRKVAAAIAGRAADQGTRAKGSVARFLASQHITYPAIHAHLEQYVQDAGGQMPAIEGSVDTQAPENKKENIVTYTAEEKPFAEFIATLETAAEQKGNSRADVEAMTERASKSDEQACMHLLASAGYTGTEQEVASVVYGAGVVVAKRTAASHPAPLAETPQPAAAVEVAAEQPKPATNAEPITSTEPANREVQAVAADLSPEEAIALVRSVTGLTDEFIGSLVGVSRPTIKNIAQGRSRTKMTEAGRRKLADHLHGMVLDLTRSRDALMLNI